MTTRIRAKSTFHAVVISCWAGESDTDGCWGTPQHVFSASAFVACVIPIAPGVNDVTLASEPEPVTHMIASNVTGIEKAARKMPVTASLHSQPRNDGRNTSSMYFRGWARI